MAPELPGRPVFQRTVGMPLVVMLEGNRQILQRRGHIGLGHEGDIVTLDCLHEALGHAIALGAAHGRGQRFEANASGELSRL